MILTQFIFWTCNFLEAVLLVRAIRGNYFGKYSLFYAYLICVFVQSLVRFYVFSWHAGLYPYFYWGTQFIDALMGCGIIFELYRQGLVRYQGAARMARNVIAFVFAVVISKVFANAISGAAWSPATIVFDLERNLRIVQSVLLIVVIGLSYYYAIAVGKNLRGMMLGYGFFLGTSIINLTIRTQAGISFQRLWEYLQPLSYVLVLGIWCAALWSYCPMELPAPEAKLEDDYQSLLAQTTTRVAQARNYLRKAVQP
jgi:hypothetical protein